MHARMDRLTLVREELERIDAFYARYPNAIGIADPERFVEHCYAVHEPWIRRWNGWEFTAEGSQGALSPYDVSCCWGYTVGRVTPRFETFCTKIWEGPAGDVPYTSVGDTARIRPGQAISRAVLAEVKKQHKDNEGYIKPWETFFERLGQRLGALVPCRALLTMRPSHFLQLGHYNENTCYQTGGAHEYSKFNLAQIPGSVVALFFPTNAELSPENVEARMWGFLGAKGVVMTNLYGQDWYRVKPALETAIQKGTGLALTEVDLPGNNQLTRLHNQETAYVDKSQHWYTSEEEFPVEDLKAAIDAHRVEYFDIPEQEDENEDVFEVDEEGTDERVMEFGARLAALVREHYGAIRPLLNENQEG